MKWAKGRSLREQNQKLPIKKDEQKYRKYISRICKETPLISDISYVSI